MTKRRISSQPIQNLFDLLGRRWALRILWELREDPMSFRVLQEACGGVSPTIVNRRVHELIAARLVVARESGYELSAEGRRLLALLAPLNAWAKKWDDFDIDF